MKRVRFIIILTLIAAFGALMIDQAASSVRPRGTQIQGSVNTASTVDSTSALQTDTTQTPSGSATKLAFFTVARDYDAVTGWFVSEYRSVDTGASGVDVDTTKDTVITRMYTSDVSGTPSKLIWTDTSVAFHVSGSVVNADYNFFDVSDSALLDNIYFEYITLLQDSVYTKARLEAALNWKHSWKVYGK